MIYFASAVDVPARLRAASVRVFCHYIAQTTASFFLAATIDWRLRVGKDAATFVLLFAAQGGGRL
jgi:hypothetical protein